jgi:6-phosphogluconate dehydrogenase
MVHNGIEYCDMQLISEAYHLMKAGLQLSAGEMAEVLARWNRGKLDSYLIEITANILAYKDSDGAPLVDKIVDAAGQKGTGRWTVETALEMGVPLTGISEAVMARSLSAIRNERLEAARVLSGPASALDVDRQAFLNDLEQAVYAAKMLSYTQGYMLMRSAAQENHWDLNYGGIALLWRGGCIIRARFLGKIKTAFDKNPELANLLLDPYFKAEVEAAQSSWRRVVARAVEAGIPVPAISSTLSFFDGYRSGWLPANLVQAQRDYFGAHTYQRVDAAEDQLFHTDWTGTGGKVTSGSYQA